MYFPQMWLGTEDSYTNHLIGLHKFYDNPSLYMPGIKAKLDSWHDGPEDNKPENERLSLSQQVAKEATTIIGNVGVLTIQGDLSRNTDFFNLYMGGMGYDSVADGIQMLLDNPAIDKIVLDMATSGGDASGIGDISSYIREASKVKPITAYTSDKALSAGYWIASATRNITMSDMAEVGSVGVVMTYTSVARMLKERGIDVYVQRAGKDKAPLHPAEPLSEKGKAHMEEKTLHLHEIFIENVLKNRQKLAQTPLDKWAEGKSFYYKDALALNLADKGPVDFNSYLSKMVTQSNSSTIATFGESVMTKKIVLTESAKAALASGAALTDVHGNEDLIEETQTQEGESTDAQAQGGEETGAAQEAAAQAAQPAEKAAQTPVEKGEPSLASYLQETVAKQSERIETLLTELNATKTALANVSGVEAALRPVAAEAIEKLQVALGQTPSKTEGMSASALAQMYAGLRDDLNARYPTGRRSLESSDESKKPKDIREARLMMVDGGKA